MPDKIQDKRKRLYDALVAADYDAGADFNDFNNLMDTDEVARQWVYDTAKSEGWKVGDNFEQFVGYITPAQESPTPQKKNEPYEFGKPVYSQAPNHVEGDIYKHGDSYTRTEIPYRTVEYPTLGEAQEAEKAEQREDALAAYRSAYNRLEAPGEVDEKTLIEWGNNMGNAPIEQKNLYTRIMGQDATNRVDLDAVMRSYDETKKSLEGVEDPEGLAAYLMMPAEQKAKLPEDERNRYEGLIKDKRKTDAVDDVNELHERISSLMEQQRVSDIKMRHDYLENRSTGQAIKDAILGIPVAETPQLQGVIPSSGLDLTPEGKLSNEQNAVLTAAGRKWNEMKYLINAAQNGNLFDGLDKALGSIDTWTSDQMLRDNMAIMRVANKFDEEGEKSLTDNERALLDALALNVAVSEMYGDEISNWYKGGEMLGEMAPFMLEMLMNPLAGLGKKAADKVTRKAIEKYGKELVKKNAKKFALTRGAAKLGASVAGATGMALTTGLPAVGADIQKRMLGDATYGYDDEGNIEYTGHVGGEDLGTSAYKAVTSRMLDNVSEMLGAEYANLPLKWLQKAGKGTKLLGWIDNLANSKFGKGVSRFAEKTKWNGPIEEFLEEVHVGLINPVLVGDQSWEEFFTKDNLATIAIGVAVPGAAISTANTIAGAADGAFKVGAQERWKMQNAEAMGYQLWQDNPNEWNDLTRSLMVGQMEDVEKTLKEVYNNSKLTPEQKKVALEYAVYSLQWRTAQGVKEAFNEGKKFIDPMLRDIYGAAYAEEVSPVQANNAYKAMAEAEKNAQRVLGIGEESVEEWLNGRSAEEATNDAAQQEALKAYQAAKLDFEGRRDRYIAEKERAYMESDRSIQANDNNGMVYATQLKDEHVFITGGNVVLNEDGTIDVDNSSETLYVKFPDGHVEMTSPDKFTEVFTSDRTADLKAAKRAEIDAKWKAEFDTAEAQSVEQEKRDSGVVFDMTDAQGEHRIEILNEGEKMSDILLDGAQMEIPTEELNRWKQEAGIQSADAMADDTTDNVAPTGDNVAPVENAPIAANPVDPKQRKAEVLSRIPMKGKQRMWTEANPADVAEYISLLTEDPAKRMAVIDGYIAKVQEAQAKAEPIEALEMDEQIAFWNGIKEMLAPQTAQAENVAQTTETTEEVGPVEQETTTIEGEDVLHPSVAAANEGRDTVGGSPVALAYLLEGGQGSILNAGYFLHGVAAAFPAVSNEIETLRAAMSEDVLGMSPTDFVAQRADEIAQIGELITNAYGEAGAAIYNELLNNASGFVPRVGAEVGARIEALQPLGEPTLSQTSDQVGEQVVDNVPGQSGVPVNDVQGGSQNGVAQEEVPVNEPVGNSEQLSSSEIPNNQSVAEGDAPGNGGVQKLVDRVLDRAEEKRRIPLRERAKELEAQVGVKANIIESVDEVADPEARRRIVAGQNVAGWYSKGQVYLYMPNIKDRREIELTYVHEVVAHHGVKKLLGERFNEFLDGVWKMMSEADRARMLAYVGANENPTLQDMRAAADEYVAELAEKMNLGELEQSTWDKIVDWFKELLENIGFENLTKEDIESMLKASYANLRSTEQRAESTGTQFRIAEVNERFNNELQQQIDGTLPEGHIYELGMPSEILRATGIPELPIQLSSKKLKEKSTDYGHDYNLEEVKDLVNALNEPLAIFTYGDKTKAQNIVVEIQSNDKNFVVGLALRPKVGGRVLEINSIRNVFPKDNAEWLNWISQGKALYLDKERVQTLIDQQRTNLADVDYLDLNSIANVINNFENPTVDSENSSKNPQDAESGIRFRKKDGERRQEKRRINDAIDTAAGFITVGGKKQATKNRLKKEAERKQLAKEMYSSVLKGDFNDVTLSQIDKFIEDATPANPFGRRISQRLPQRMERALRQGARANAVDALFSRISESAVPANERFSEAGRREIEERKKELLKGWAIATGNWHTDLKEFTDDTEPIGEGKDSKVYSSKDGRYVIKASKGKPFGKRFRPDIDNIALFNDVFRDTRYEILGYGEIDGEFVRILQQPIVDFAESTPLTSEERREYMQSLGFEPLNDANTAFADGEIVIADLQKGNVVRDAAGNISVIDADAKLHTKDVGGDYTYPPVETDLPEGTDLGGTMFRKGNPTLLGTHSITEDKLRKAIRMGGLANPSTAVFELGEEIPGEYGEITFVMPSSMVDKKTGRNTGAFAGDAWTPTYPQVERQMGKRGSARAREDVQSVPKEMQKEVRMGLNSWLDGREGAGLAYLFLQEEGLAPELSRVAQRYSDEIRNRVGEIAHGEPFYRLSPEQKQEIVDLYIEQYYNGDKAYYSNYLNEKLAMMQEKLADVNAKSFIKRSIQQYIDGVNEYGFDYEAVSDFLNKVQRDIDHSGVVNDRATTQEAARVIREKGLEREFQMWKEELLDRYEIKEVIFKGFTPTGNRRYVPHTLENVSKDMKEQGRNGAVGLNATFNKFAAGLLKPLGSLDAIRKRKGNLRATHADTEAFRDKWSEVYYDLAEKLQPDAKGYEDYGLDRVAEAATKKDPKAFIKSEYGIELSEADEKALKDMVWAIQYEYPVMYFETKFERPVYLDEFAGVVIPENTGSDVVESLENAGLKIETYEPGNEKARAEAIKRLTEEDDRIMFRRANKNQDIFVSNAQRAVEGIQQNKATAEQWIAMLKKNGGLKAGEDAWMGLEEWLNEKQGAVTKQEILDYIAQNRIQIEEVEYVNASEMEDLRIPLEKSHGKDFADKFFKAFDIEYGEFGIYDEQEAVDLYNEANGADIQLDEEGYWDDFVDREDILNWASRVMQDARGDAREIYHTRLDYTTDGLNNKREIALTVPTVEPYNIGDYTHFGDAGNGRAVAWVRFGETTDSEGNRVLVIDEIQSKRHQDGREKGYRSNADKFLKDNGIEVVETDTHIEFYKNGEIDKRFAKALFNTDIEKAKNLYVAGYEKTAVPAAPFEKNWHELAMKRMLRLAAEEGFDKVAWTTGEQQAQRYDMSRQVEGISVEENMTEEFSDGTPVAKNITISTANGMDIRIDTDAEGVIHGGEYGGKHLSDVVGKEIAEKIIQPGSFTLEGEGLRIGGEGMKGFYDRMLPSFVQKYTKKWGAKVGEVTMPDLGENNTMHSVDVTPEMKESVMEGQTMFRITDTDRQALEFKRQHKGSANIVAIDTDALVAELLAQGFTAEEIQNIREKYKKGGRAFYDRDRNTIYLLGKDRSEKKNKEDFWHENTHKTIGDLDIPQEVMDEFYAIPSKRFIEFFEGKAKEFYGPEEYAEELIAYFVEDVQSNGNYDNVTKALGTSAEGMERLKEIVEPIINYINHGRRVDEGTEGNNRTVVRETLYDNDVEESQERARTEAEGAEETRFSTRGEGIDNVPTQPLTLMERITNSLLEVSAKNKENLELRASALRTFGRDINRVLSLMKAQREYDKSTVDTLVKLAKMYFQNAQLLGEVTPYEVARIMGVLNRSVGKRDISTEAAKLMDILLDAHANALAGILDKAEKIKAKKVNAAGVEVMGRLDKYGQKRVDEYRAAKGMTPEKLEEAIYDSDNRLAELEQRVREVLGIPDGDVDLAAREYTGDNDVVNVYMDERARLEGLTLAREYKESIQQVQEEIKDLKRELKQAEEDYRLGNIDGKSLKEFRKSVAEAIMESKAELIEGYHSLIYKFQENNKESSQRAKEFAQAQIDRAREIQHNANSDMEGIPADTQGTHPENYNNAVMNALRSPFPTFQGMLKKFGEKNVEGKGYLYDRFMPQATQASDNEFRGKVAARVMIEAKLKEIYGEKANIARFMKELREYGATVTYREENEMKQFDLTKGQMLYIYMVNKMADGQMKLRRMGITDDVVAELMTKLPEEAVQFADWAQNELLKDLRGKYNAVHERVFGAPMAAGDSKTGNQLIDIGRAVG